MGSADDSTNRFLLVDYRDPWDRYWWWFGIGLFFLLGLDFATTVTAVSVHGLDAEANPLMRWLLGHGIGMALLVNLFVLGCSVLGFSRIVAIGRSLRGTAERYYRHCCSVWIASLVLVGIVVCLNNIAVITIGLLTI